MATSQTVGRTSVSVTSLVEHAFRRCGKLASTISGELQMSAKENLFFLLTDLANRGLSLFCQKKTVLQTIADNVTSAAALTTDQGPVLVEGPACDLERLDYRQPVLLPPARG